MARYKFQCRACKYEFISGIGREIGAHSTKVTMVCKSCESIDSYVVANPGSINTEIGELPICKGCYSAKDLLEWDGLTCPHCQMKMRALGGDVDSERPFKYW